VFDYRFEREATSFGNHMILIECLLTMDSYTNILDKSIADTGQMSKAMIVMKPQELNFIILTVSLRISRVISKSNDEMMKTLKHNFNSSTLSTNTLHFTERRIMSTNR